MNAGTNFAEEFPLNRMSDTTNISSAKNATMLILSPCIYAKKSSNAFYSGNIQNRLPDGSYLVKFTDGSIESVEERDIMWLGFWGLPPSTWPQTPLVHSVGAINMEFPKGLVQNDNTNGPTSHSVPLKIPSREGDEAADKQGNEFSELGMNYDVSAPSETRQNAGEISSFEAVNSAHRMPRQQCQWPENQARLSVLKMCNDGPGNIANTFNSMEEKLEGPVSQTMMNVTGNTTRKRKVSYKSHTPLVLGKDASTVDRTNLDGEPPCGFIDLTSPSQKAVWQSGISYPFNIPPIVTPRPLSSSLSSFDVPRFESFSHSPQSGSTFSLENSRLFGQAVQGKRPKQELSMNCRKVYGINNKRFWCAQCKGNKPCTKYIG